jgi:hypothetical protein
VGINEAGDQFFDFNKTKVQTLSIDQLERTNREHNVYGQPIMGIYHCELLRNLEDLAQRSGLHIEYDEIFAANGGASSSPGVALLPHVEERYGERAIEAHILRRVYANMVIRDFDTNEFTTQMAVSFHQDGIQVGFGNQVRICHNLTMLGRSQSAATYGRGAVDIPTLLQTVRSWLNNAQEHIEADREQIRRMKSIGVDYHQNCMMLGALQIQRVCHDTKIREIRSGETYPLNGTQINRLTESLEVEYNKANGDAISLWQWYNCATELHKAGRSDVPTILPQNIALNTFLNQMIGADL